MDEGGIVSLGLKPMTKSLYLHFVYRAPLYPSCLCIVEVKELGFHGMPFGSRIPVG